jgi:hypothetical protein
MTIAKLTPQGQAVGFVKKHKIITAAAVIGGAIAIYYLYEHYIKKTTPAISSTSTTNPSQQATPSQYVIPTITPSSATSQPSSSTQGVGAGNSGTITETYNYRASNYAPVNTNTNVYANQNTHNVQNILKYKPSYSTTGAGGQIGLFNSGNNSGGVGTGGSFYSSFLSDTESGATSLWDTITGKKTSTSTTAATSTTTPTTWKVSSSQKLPAAPLVQNAPAKTTTTTNKNIFGDIANSLMLPSIIPGIKLPLLV